MEPEQRRKRKRVVARHLHISSRSLFLCFSFLIFIFFLSSYHHFFTPSTFRPSLTASTLSLLYSSASHSILDPLQSTTPSYTLQHRILFPDHHLLILTNHQQHHQLRELECVYYTLHPNDSSPGSPESLLHVQVRPVLSTDRYDESRSIVRCPFTETNYSAAAGSQGPYPFRKIFSIIH